MKSMISSKNPSVISRIIVLFAVACMSIVPAFAVDIAQKATNFISSQLVWVAILVTVWQAVKAAGQGNYIRLIISVLIGGVVAALIHDPQYIITTGQAIFNAIK